MQVLQNCITNATIRFMLTRSAGKQKGAERTVAVKVIDCRNFRDLSDLDAMRNEIAVMATLRHPHIMDLLGSAYVGDRFFIVMEFAPGDLSASTPSVSDPTLCSHQKWC
jgi:serine/threonine protein kinase